MSTQFSELVRQCRAHCLWFLDQDVMPDARDAQLRVLEYVERYGNRDEFIRARRLKQWLSRHSNERFVVS